MPLFLAAIPYACMIVVLGAAWHWAAEMLKALRSINQSLRVIAGRETDKL
jgi:hypothetical protein